MENLLWTFHCPRTEDAVVNGTSVGVLSTVRHPEWLTVKLTTILVLAVVETSWELLTVSKAKGSRKGFRTEVTFKLGTSV